MNIVDIFEKLKRAGLKAKNPDQSAAMFRVLQEQIDVCRQKGFSEEDIDILFGEAKKALVKKSDDDDG